ncbi:hypothetical protein M5689_001816 [Euphorbia peplus]|nr:hypothetical protein M5689_001816 [Euphorbia peplus]
MSTIIRRKNNKIEALKDDSGGWLYELEDIRKHAKAFYSNLYSCDPGQPTSPLTSMHTFPKVEETRLNFIFKQVETNDIHTALTEMAPTKAPDIDGLPAVLFQNHWDEVKLSVCNFILKVFAGIETVDVFNQNLIAIIPKIPNPVSLSQYRPISLCNVIYKIITKIIANRFKLLFPEIIAPTQSSFVPGRQIVDNIIVAQEVIHSMRIRKGKQGLVAIKIDMEKNYY